MRHILDLPNDVPIIDDGNHCNHGITFDQDAARGLSAPEVRKRWPRGFGPCPLGCGWDGIYYASYAHYVYGDW